MYPCSPPFLSPFFLIIQASKSSHVQSARLFFSALTVPFLTIVTRTTYRLLGCSIFIFKSHKPKSNRLLDADCSLGFWVSFFWWSGQYGMSAGSEPPNSAFRVPP